MLPKLPHAQKMNIFYELSPKSCMVSWAGGGCGPPAAEPGGSWERNPANAPGGATAAKRGSSSTQLRAASPCFAEQPRLPAPLPADPTTITVLKSTLA